MACSAEGEGRAFVLSVVGAGHCGGLFDTGMFANRSAEGRRRSSQKPCPRRAGDRAPEHILVF